MTGTTPSLAVDDREGASNQALLYPLRFEPIYQYRLWGGRHLASLLTAPLPNGPIGEAWLLSDRDDHQSRVADGLLKGQTIGQLLQQVPEANNGKAGWALPPAAEVPRRSRNAFGPGASHQSALALREYGSIKPANRQESSGLALRWNRRLIMSGGPMVVVAAKILASPSWNRCTAT